MENLKIADLRGRWIWEVILKQHQCHSWNGNGDSCSASPRMGSLGIDIQLTASNCVCVRLHHVRDSLGVWRISVEDFVECLSSFSMERRLTLNIYADSSVIVKGSYVSISKVIFTILAFVLLSFNRHWAMWACLPVSKVQGVHSRIP